MMGRYLLFVLALAFSVDSASVMVKDDSDCGLCTATLREVKIAWFDKDTQDLLKIGQEVICANVPITDCNNWISSELVKLSETIKTLNVHDACTAVKQCTTRHDTWPVDSDEKLEGISCTVCEFLGNELKKKLFSDATIEQVIAMADEICAELPFGSSECKAMVDEYGKLLMEMIAGSINVDQLCADMGLCSADLQHMLEAMEIFQVVSQGLKEGEGCRACVDGMTIVQTVITSDDVKDLINIGVKEVCDLTGYDECEFIAKMIVDKMLKKFVAKFNPKTICESFGACTGELLTDSISTSPLCEVCTDGLDEIKKISHDKLAEVIIIHFSEVACRTLPIPFCSGVLPHLLNKQLEKLKTLDVAANCAKLGACTSSTLFDAYLEKEGPLGDTCSECAMVVNLVLTALENKQINSLVKEVIGGACTVLPISDCAKTLDGYFDELVALLSFGGKTVCGLIGLCGSRTETPVPFVALGDTCSECAMVADELISTLESEEVESMIKETISEVCSVLPISDCEKTLDGYFDELMELLKAIDGKTLCELFGLCSSTIEIPMPTEVGESCDECAQMAEFFLVMVRDPANHEFVQEFVDSICYGIPEIPYCNKTVWDLIETMDGKTACAILGICDFDESFYSIGDTCSECTSIVSALKAALDKEAMDGLVKDMIGEVCSVLPTVPHCTEILGGYFSDLEVFLKSKDDETICGMIGRCADPEPEPVIPVGTLEDSCSECEEVANLLLAELKNPSYQELVEDNLRLVCKVLPIPNCTATVHEYMQLVEEAVDSMDGKTLCNYIGFC